MTSRPKKLTSTLLLAGSAQDCPDLEYASGFRAPDPVVFVRRGAQRLLVVSALEYGRARRTAEGIEVCTPEMLRVPAVGRGRIEEWARAAVRRIGGRSVTVPAEFPLGIARHLERCKIKVNVATGALFPERAVKRADELRKITESQRAAVAAFHAARELLTMAEVNAAGELVMKQKRVTSELLRETIQRVLFHHNCIGRDLISAGGAQGADPHEQGHGPLRAGEPIVVDIFPQHQDHGYWGDLTRTVIKGKASREWRRLYTAVRAAQHAALEELRPGVKGKTVHRRAAEELERRGFKTWRGAGRVEGFIHSTGHGVGLEIHEQPTLGPRTDDRLRTGHVVTVEPGYYIPGVGGIRIEDTVVVTPGGWRYLARCDQRFEVE